MAKLHYTHQLAAHLKITLRDDIDFKYLGMKADLDEDGVYLSSKKTVMIEDTHGTQYKVTIEAID